jgi:hypothetical protein
MKKRILKIEAAYHQLIMAIRLFFEDEDPISTHTLASAVLGILHAHFSKDEACEHNLMLHYESIYIKDEYRKDFCNLVRKPQNFFKHADQDRGEFIDFETDSTVCLIWEAIRCLIALEKENLIFSPEFAAFQGWFFANNPELFKESAATTKLLVDLNSIEFSSKKIVCNFIKTCKINKISNMKTADLMQ